MPENPKDENEDQSSKTEDSGTVAVKPATSTGKTFGGRGTEKKG